MVLFRCQAPLVALTVSISVVQSSILSPHHEISKAVASTPAPPDMAEVSLPSSAHARRISIAGATPSIHIRTQGMVPPGQMVLKVSRRGPNCQLLPIRVSAVVLHAFYLSLAQWASTVLPQSSHQPQHLITITQGSLQLTMSSLGMAVPWQFVEAWAMSAAESVMRGWTDTFDEIYETEGTGLTVWVSLKLLEG